MPKIVIDEIDNTRPGPVSQSDEIVYIPGFVDVLQEQFTRTKDPLTPIEVNKPTLFNDLSEFRSLCGEKPATFPIEQKYSDLGSLGSFTPAAVPDSGVLFSEGAADPGYVMASELLSQGLSVLFERINPATESRTSVGSSEPDDWDSEDAYYEATVGAGAAYHAVSQNYFSADELYVNQKGTDYDGTNTYYAYYDEKIIKGSTVKHVFSPLTEVPQDSQGRITISCYTGEDITTTNIVLLQPYSVEGPDTFLRPLKNKKQTICYMSIDSGTIGVDVYPDGTVELISLSDGSYQLPDSFFEGDSAYYNATYYSYQTTSDVTVDNTTAFLADLTWYKISYSTNADVRVIYQAFEGNQAFEGIFDTAGELADPGTTQFKYLTTGGYPVFEFNNNLIVSAMLKLAETRGDCVAFIDHTDNPGRTLDPTQSSSVYQAVVEANFGDIGTWGTLFTPWATYNCSSVGANIRMPGSYAYFECLAKSIENQYPSWFAIAGSARGVVPYIAGDNGFDTIIPNNIADKMQPREGTAINPITQINPFGITIWGNRTLKKNVDNLVATSFLNIRNLVSSVKKVAYRTAKRLTFEQNNDVLWVNFKAGISPTLDRMLNGYGISGYKIIRDLNHEKATEKATLTAKIILYPVYAVEDFYITVQLEDDEVTVVEG